MDAIIWFVGCGLFGLGFLAAKTEAVRDIRRLKRSHKDRLKTQTQLAYNNGYGEGYREATRLATAMQKKDHNITPIRKA